MKQILRVVATLVATAGLGIGFAGAAAGLPTADFAVSSSSPNVDESVTFTASAFCDEPPCRFQWRWYRTVGNDRLGTTMGEGEEIQFAFSTAGAKLVVLKVTNSTLTHGFATAQAIVTVVGGPEETPPPAETSPPEATSPPQETAPPEQTPPPAESTPVDPTSPEVTTAPDETTAEPTSASESTPAPDPTTAPATAPGDDGTSTPDAGTTTEDTTPPASTTASDATTSPEPDDPPADNGAPRAGVAPVAAGAVWWTATLIRVPIMPKVAV